MSRLSGRGPARLGTPGVVAAGVLAAAVVGSAGGVLWPRLTPVVRLRRVSGGLLLDETTGARLFAAEGWFAVVALVGGVLIGVVAVASAARLGRVTIPAAALVALGAGVLAWRLGVAIGAGPGSDVVPLRLGGRSVLGLWPLGTGVVAVLAALVAPGRFDRPRSFDGPHRSPSPVEPSVGAPAGGRDVGGR